MEIEFKGKCKGVKLVERGKDDNHICIQFLTEDDGYWYEDGQAFSSHWIDDLIEQLQEAKNYISTQEPYIYEGQQYGWNFK